MNTDFAIALREAASDDPLTMRLIDVVTHPTGMSTAGYPYLQRQAWETFRDRVPHILGMGLRTLRAAFALGDVAETLDAPEDEIENVRRAVRVIRQVVFTATITAPPDLWLMRHVLGWFEELGLLERLRRGEAIYPESCTVDGRRLDAGELETDLHFLLARGVVEQYEDSFRIAGHPRVLEIFDTLEPIPAHIPAGVTRLWRRFFAREALEASERDILLELGNVGPPRTTVTQNHWMPNRVEIETGYRLLPVVLGMRDSALTADVADRPRVTPDELAGHDVEVARAAVDILEAAGWLERDDDEWAITATGARGLTRGPGPFGIIETYHPYMERGAQILLGLEDDVWVRRGENVGASQDANRKTFRRANDALDRFCEDTGFEYDVFIEHAIGRGEATRQRYERSGDDSIRYFGADLEDAAIDAAMEEQRRGNLPSDMVFVRQADIGEPEVLLEAIRREGCDTRGAVMLVGNGFHEVRDQSDEKMIDVFRGYHEAGIILVFTEENALAVDDLRATAFNTYHSGFKYVHEKSGQGLRPAHPRERPRLGNRLRAPWSICAGRANYVRLDEYSSRTRTIYPYTPPGGRNPSISVSHFVVPRFIASELGLI